MMRNMVVATAAGVAWLTWRERNPLKWPALVRNEVQQLGRDASEALVDGARAGRRAEAAFDHELDAVRKNARTW